MQINGFELTNKAQNKICTALSLRRLSHAIIIEGGTASERLSVAKAIARVLVCGSEETAPCESCAHCRKSSVDAHPDIIFIEPRTENKSTILRVDQIREIREQSSVLPNEAEKKVFILSDTQLMNVQAQNAFLKIMEEPPEFVNFILLCNNKSNFLDTIMSRATSYTIGETKTEELSGVSFEDSLNAALKIADAILEGTPFALVKAAGVFDKDKKLMESALPILQEIVSDSLRMKFTEEGNNERYADICRSLANKYSKRILLNEFDNIGVLIESVSLNANNNLTVARLASLLASALN